MGLVASLDHLISQGFKLDKLGSITAKLRYFSRCRPVVRNLVRQGVGIIPKSRGLCGMTHVGDRLCDAEIVGE